MIEASDTTRSELGGDGIITTGGTGSILLSGILDESKDSRSINNNTHTYDKKVQV